MVQLHHIISLHSFFFFLTDLISLQGIIMVILNINMSTSLSNVSLVPIKTEIPLA